MKRAALLIALISVPAFAELVDRIAAVVNKDIIALSEVEARAAPELQRIRADEHGISRCEEVVFLPIAGTLPVQFDRVDENEPC